MRSYLLVLFPFTCSYHTIHYLHVSGACNMNSICVGACFWCSYNQMRGYYIYTCLNRNMHLLAVLDSQVFQYQVSAGIEAQSLLKNQKSRRITSVSSSFLTRKPRGFKQKEFVGERKVCQRKNLYNCMCVKADHQHTVGASSQGCKFTT